MMIMAALMSAGAALAQDTPPQEPPEAKTPPIPATPKALLPNCILPETTPKFKWTVSSGATTYLLQVYTSGGTWVYTKGVQASTCGTSTCANTPTNVLAPGGYKWRVAAKNSSGTSPYSAYMNFQISATGFNTQFNGSTGGWKRKAGGTWSIVSGSYYGTQGINGKITSAYYPATYCSFDYSARVKRDDFEDGVIALAVRMGNKVLASDYTWYPGYYFAILDLNEQGQYAIYRLEKDGNLVELQPWTPSTAIKRTGWNVMRVIGKGSSFKFYLNGTLVKTLTDGKFKSGQVGIVMDKHAASSIKTLADWAKLTPKASKY